MRWRGGFLYQSVDSAFNEACPEGQDEIINRFRDVSGVTDLQRSLPRRAG